MIYLRQAREKQVIAITKVRKTSRWDGRLHPLKLRALPSSRCASYSFPCPRLCAPPSLCCAPNRLSRRCGDRAQRLGVRSHAIMSENVKYVFIKIIIQNVHYIYGQSGLLHEYSAEGRCDEIVACRRTFVVVDCFPILSSGRLEQGQYSSSRAGCAVATGGAGRSGSKSLARAPKVICAAGAKFCTNLPLTTAIVRITLYRVLVFFKIMSTLFHPRYIRTRLHILVHFVCNSCQFHTNNI